MLNIKSKHVEKRGRKAIGAKDAYALGQPVATLLFKVEIQKKNLKKGKRKWNYQEQKEYHKQLLIQKLL